MIHVRSIGLRAADILHRDPLTGRVLAWFDRACDLITDDGSVFAFGWAGVPDGPFNILLVNRPGAALPAGTRFVVSGGIWQASAPGCPPLQVSLSPAEPWDPVPDWESLRARRPVILRRLPRLVAAVQPNAPPDSLVGPTLEHADLDTARPHLLAAGRAIRAILSAWEHGEPAALERAVGSLCGLGPGLTPAGDDWLAGWLLALTLVKNEPAGQPGPEGSARALALADAQAAVASAAWRTNTLGQAFLKCAVAGEADANWHALLDALAGEDDRGLRDAALAILAHGATSGADMLAGFLGGLEGAGVAPTVGEGTL